MTITPEQDADLAQVKSELQKMFSPKDLREEPIGFGIKVIKIMFVRDDKKGHDTDTDVIENKIRTIKGVADVRTDDVTLL